MVRKKKKTKKQNEALKYKYILRTISHIYLSPISRISSRHG